MGAACDSNKCSEALQCTHVWEAAEAGGLRLEPPAWPSLQGRPVEPCQRCPPEAGSPLHAGGTMSRQCAPSGGQLRCSLKTLAPTSEWATRCSRCRWACQTALHLLFFSPASLDLTCAAGRRAWLWLSKLRAAASALHPELWQALILGGGASRRVGPALPQPNAEPHAAHRSGSRERALEQALLHISAARHAFLR